MGVHFTSFDDEFVVAIPGTHNLVDWLADLSAWPWRFAVVGLCHDGFGKDAEALWAVIKPLLPADKLITFTGHSLGGARAQIFAAYHVAESPRRCRVVTFGAPRVVFFLNRVFARLIAGTLESVFYERRGDIVTDVPPRGFLHPALGVPIGAEVETLDPAVNHSMGRYTLDLDALEKESRHV